MHISQKKADSSTDGVLAHEVDFTREEAVYEREKGWLERDHIGKVVVIHGDDLIGVFLTPGEAISVAVDRFGLEPVMIAEIRDPKEPLDYLWTVDEGDVSFSKFI